MERAGHARGVPGRAGIVSQSLCKVAATIVVALAYCDGRGKIPLCLCAGGNGRVVQLARIPLNDADTV